MIDLAWYATANNVELNDDMARRVVFSRIDAKMEFPFERPRTAFKHQDIRQWSRDNRGRLIWAALTMARAWISRGRPPGAQVMGSYEAWAETIGGILQVRQILESTVIARPRAAVRTDPIRKDLGGLVVAEPDAEQRGQPDLVDDPQHAERLVAAVDDPREIGAICRRDPQGSRRTTRKQAAGQKTDTDSPH